LTGLLTLVALLLGYQLGGWWWAGFVFFFLAWMGELQQAKEKGSKIQNKEPASKSNSEINNRAALISIGGWPSELIDVCSSLTSNGYYVGNLIPNKKRRAALENYPPPGNSDILALIDGTLFGTATQGLVVGKNGVSWKNGYSQPVQMSWRELAKCEIASAELKVSVGNEKFDNSFSGIKLPAVEGLFILLRDYARALSSDDKIPEARSENEHSSKPKAVDGSRLVVAINIAEFDELLALPGIGAAEAKMIIKRRDESPFKSVAEMADFLDLKPHLISRLDSMTEFRTAQKPSTARVDAQSPVESTQRIAKPGGRTID
jgi:DNA uptake protein ComE-like DNA-binding protein